MKHGFVKVAAATPKVRVADPAYNVAELIRLTKQADKDGVSVLVFPELALTAYTCGDLFLSDTLLNATQNALGTYLKETKDTSCVSFVGIPWVRGQKLYNCAAVCQRGTLLGIVPKSILPDYGEFSEARWFAPAPEEDDATVEFGGQAVPFGTRLLFRANELPALTIAAELCEDVWGTIPPSCAHTAAGATVVCNLSASDEAIGKEDYRRELVKTQSARTCSAYLYASSGDGESTTDLVFGGHDLIVEDGTILAEKAPFDASTELLETEIDVLRLCYERRKISTFLQKDCGKYREIRFSIPMRETKLKRPISVHPFSPDDPSELAARCERILTIQSYGLKQRIERAWAQKLVIGISGGLDSTLALLVAARASDLLKRPRKDIIAVTMPCFGTTKRTKNNATVLCEELGVDFRCVDIYDAVNVHFRDIGHDEKDHNVAYENAQARERTQVLMDIANDCGGMVIGTGDLSELALGWATYNGDHMSMYGVNADVPKTLVRHVVSHCADVAEADGKKALAAALRDVLDTPVSPELLPADQSGNIAQKTEDLVGPYELHDFFLYYAIRYAFPPEKLYRLAKYAFGKTYSDEVIKKWLKTFFKRFFSQQFKRSCLPDGPKVGSVGLSPRGDWKMPSDASNAAWIEEIDNL